MGDECRQNSKQEGRREGSKLEGFVDWVLRNVFGRAESKITEAIFSWGRKGIFSPLNDLLR